MMSRAAYRWNSFKMRWLVPNWERAVGPAFWIYRIKEWLKYNMDSENCCSLLHKLIEWKDKKLAKWLTPHLKYARKLFSFCINMNDTKLLWHKANYFYIRTRDANQFYFTGEVTFAGEVKITKTQWIDSKGVARNTFMYGILSDEEPEENPLTKKEEVIWQGKVLSEEDFENAKEALLKMEEFCWDEFSIAEDRLVNAVKPADEFEFKKALHAKVLERDFPGIKNWWDLTDEDYGKFKDTIINIDIDEVKKMTEENV